MKIIVKIELIESEFENVAKITIAGMLLKQQKINKKNIIKAIKHNIHQAGEFYINFTRDSDPESSDFFDDNDELVNEIYNRYFKI